MTESPRVVLFQRPSDIFQQTNRLCKRKRKVMRERKKRKRRDEREEEGRTGKGI